MTLQYGQVGESLQGRFQFTTVRTRNVEGQWPTQTAIASIPKREESCVRNFDIVRAIIVRADPHEAFVSLHLDLDMRAGASDGLWQTRQCGPEPSRVHMCDTGLYGITNSTRTPLRPSS